MSLKLYYTNSETSLGTQTDPRKSLGNHISSSLVPSDFINNLFADISELSKDRNLTETVGLALKNETGAIAENIELWYNYPTTDSQVKLEVASVATSLNDCDEPIIEKIPNIFAKPVNATFFEANGESNKVSLGDLADNGYLGLWFRKSLRPIVLTAKTCDDLVAEKEAGTTFDKTETIELIIKWGADASVSVSLSV